MYQETSETRVLNEVHDVCNNVARTIYLAQLVLKRERERERERRVSVYEEAPGFRPGPRVLKRD